MSEDCLLKEKTEQVWGEGLVLKRSFLSSHCDCNCKLNAVLMSALCLTKNGSVISQGIDRGEEAQGPIPLTAELFAIDR